ncbi:MAG: CsbD family protein [Aphanizomenon flos-aquae Clear-A1]|nr:CsbD family protein [Aphanizomenon flos-aquae Clear-A1]
MASMNRVDATNKNIEGKVQEAVGNVTGNKKDQFMGKAKQAESKVRNAVEDIKDASLKQKSKAVIKKMEIKSEKAIDNSIVNPNYLPRGKTNDIKSESRNPANKMKEELRNTFN